MQSYNDLKQYGREIALLTRKLQGTLEMVVGGRDQLSQDSTHLKLYMIWTNADKYEVDDAIASTFKNLRTQEEEDRGGWVRTSVRAYQVFAQPMAYYIIEKFSRFAGEENENSS